VTRDADEEGQAMRTTEFIVKDGKPVAVILDIERYREMLERLEDLEYLKLLEEMRKKPLKFRKLEEFLEEYGSDV